LPASVLDRLLRRLRKPTPEPLEPDRLALDREQRLAERFLENEALRGDLDDATWQPVQDWLLLGVKQLALSTSGLDDAAAEPLLDAGQTGLRQVVGDLVDALSVEAGDPAFVERIADVVARLQPPLVEAANVASTAAALQAAAQDLASAGADGLTAAARLTAVLADAWAAGQVTPEGER
jgi:hypothetical protein